MKTIILNTIYLFILLFLFTGCDPFVEVDLPSGQLTAPAVFEDYTTANAAMADVYANLRSSSLITGGTDGVSYLMGIYADEMDYYGSASTGSASFYTNSLTATNGTVAGLWNTSYNEIYSVNAIIEGVAASTTLQQAQKERLTGEALFVRGLIHFYLVNLYGAVPYITTTDYEVNRHATRMPIDAVYQNIIADLTQAQTLLPEDIVPERIRPNKSAASALLARVYLYQGDWAEAANSASAVLNNSNYAMESDMDAVFLKGSTSTIWQFKPMAEGVNAAEGGLFVFTSGPPPVVALGAELIAAFEPGDQRLVHWVGTVTDGVTTWYHANKYKEQAITGTSLEYSIVLRLGEQYLIRAEARARQGELIGAKEDLNVIRQAAGLGDIGAVTQQELLDAILRERRVELLTEHGHRFFDLKRNGLLDPALGPVKPGWNNTDQLLPIPEGELLLNPLLAPQNPGY